MNWYPEDEEDSRDNELREINEAISNEEKRLLQACRNLSYLSSSHRLVTIDDDEEESERVSCEKQLLVYGDVLTSLEAADRSHEAEITVLRAALEREMSKYKSLRERLTGYLIQLRTSLMTKQEKKNITQEELERNIKRQEAVEQTVIKLRTLNLLATPTPTDQMKEKTLSFTAAEELALRERHESTEQQLSQVKRLLERQETERRRDELRSIRLAERKEALERDLRTLQSDRDMARLEYTDVCRQYKEEQRLSRALESRVEEARTGRRVATLASQHKDVIWRVLTLDTAVKQASQKCASLQAAIRRSEIDEQHN